MNLKNDELKNLANLDVNVYVRKDSGACEENVKIKIVVPLLILLGYNTQQDMDFEHNVQNKKADIALIFDNKPKLLVETKDLDAQLEHHVNQALNYAYLNGIEWVMLTNGTEIRIYKSFIPGFDTNDRKLFETSLQRLVEDFDVLEGYVGKEHILEAKKLNEKVESLRENITVKNLVDDLSKCREKLFKDLFAQFKDRYESDSQFRDTIDNWAIEVKMDVSDSGLVEKLCREGAYALINRVLFLRICEDKGHVKSKLTKDAIQQWRQMVVKPSNMLKLAFDEIGEQFEGLYKSPIFDSMNFEDINWNSETIQYILDKLGEHDFSKITKDILGKAYEAHISIQERKQLGQFYTPDAVIDYILDRVELSTEKKIIDPACGSGGFLMKTYDRLRKMYLDGGWAQDLIHSKILENNIFGVDINPFATQLTVMNLLLKDLDHPTAKLNIVEGDSLEKKLDNAFDLDTFHTTSPVAKVTKGERRASLVKLLANRPYDIVISNPPYGYRGIIPEDRKKYFRQNYSEIFKGSFDLYQFFIIRGFDLLAKGGKLGFIVPNTFLSKPSSIKLRDFLLKNAKILEIVELGQSAFDVPTVESIIFIVEKTPTNKDDTNEITVRQGKVLEDKKTIQILRSSSIKQNSFWQNTDLIFNIWQSNIINKIRIDSINLGDLAHITVGINTGYIKDVLVSDKKRGDNFHKMLAGDEIGRYSITWGGKWICYDGELVKSYGKQGRSLPPEWVFTKPKILIQRTRRGMKRKLNATFDGSGYYNLNRLSNIIIKDEKISPKYILAILNSNLMDYYFQNYFNEYEVKPYHLKQLPIKIGGQDTQEDLIKLVDKLLELQQSLGLENDKLKKERLNAEVNRIDELIDEKVYELYGFVERDEKLRFLK